MDGKKERLWQAYLDGELSTGESAEFEQSLSPSEREGLASEMRFERALAERLGENAHCPDEVWERTKALVAGAEAPALAQSSRRRWYWGVATLAAASIAFVLSLYTTGDGAYTLSSAILAASSI